MDSREQFEGVSYRIEEEGFDYCFCDYSYWEEIEDEKFHELRKNYLKAKDNLQAYVDSKVT